MCARTHQKDVFISKYFKEKLYKKLLYVEMMGLIGAGNNPMVGMTVAVAVAIEQASK